MSPKFERRLLRPIKTVVIHRAVIFFVIPTALPSADSPAPVCIQLAERVRFMRTLWARLP